MLGPYRLDSVAGEGGMGRVFRATHTKLNKRVAVKVLRRRYASHPDAIARFFQEARAVNVIRHPNIVEITDFVEAPTGGDSYYIMEWLEGRTLAQHLARHPALPVETVIAVGRQTASALAAVHKAGFVHRDLKPDNVFLIERDGKLIAKVLDFGVAMLQGPTDGAVAGTPAYFSPEGAAGRALDGRSDIYSLGVMLYELLAGSPPFQASSLSEYVMKHMTAKPRPIQEVAKHPIPPGLAAAIARCLQKAPEIRFQTMDELEAALAVLEAEVARGRPAARWLLIGGAGLAVALLAAGVTAKVRHRAPSSAAIESRVAAPAAKAPREEADPQRIVVVVSSEPEGAEVYEDQVMLGLTPCAVRLLPGKHSLELARQGFRRTPILVEATRGATAFMRLLPAPAHPAGKRAAPSRNGTINPFE